MKRKTHMRIKLFFLCFLISCFVVTSCTNAFPWGNGFNAWKKDFEKQALAEGVDPDFLKQILPEIKELPHIVASDKKQPEFRFTFWNYTDRAISERRISKGKEMMETHKEVLARAEAKYGVRAQYIVAFWGLETSYGSYKGNIEIMNALATMAYEGRRRTFFTKELIAFLKIMQMEELYGIKGSWAGAFGNFQFMPTTFVAYAVDADGDGKRDVVGSIPDAVESAANYLAQMGWNKDVRWGREVKLTKPLNWDIVHDDTKKTVEQWAKMGVEPADGTRWNSDDFNVMAELTLPMGIDGPVFLTYQNYKIIMRWNRSQLYALSIGLLADKLDGKPGKIYAPRDNTPFSFEEGKEIQELLTKKGYYTGEIDGQLGSGTRTAIRAYQRDNKLPQDGYATTKLLNKMKGI